MLSDATKQKLRHVVLLGTIVSFPLLYLGPVTLESAAVTVAGLAGCEILRPPSAEAKVGVSLKY